MISEEALFEQVARYLKNRLSQEERTAFEQQYRTDADFAMAANACARTIGIVEVYGRNLTRMAFKERRKKRKERRQKVLAIRRYSAAAALVLLLVVIPLFYYLSSPSLSRLYANHFETVLASPGRDYKEGIDHRFYEGLEHYNEKRYKKAVSLLKPLSQNNAFPRQSEASFYLGVAFMSSEQFEEALNSFGRIGTTSGLLQKTQWYRGLCYLKLKDKEKALESFKAIVVQEDHYKKEEAQELIEALE